MTPRRDLSMVEGGHEADIDIFAQRAGHCHHWRQMAHGGRHECKIVLFLGLFP